METPCIEWKKSLRNGYGQKAITVDGKFKNVRVHRWAWEQVNGPVPAGVMVLHRCNNKKCYNVEHLYLGGAKENQQDCIASGVFMERISRGERHGKAILTEEKVRYIREARSAGMTVAAIARVVGVKPTTVNSVVRGLTWRHVS